MSPRTKLALIMAMFALPTLASFTAFYLLPPPKSSNYGELISPAINLPQLPLVVSGGADAPPGAAEQGLRGKWLLVTRDSGACGPACEQKLFAMRQARLIVGREMDRVVRVVLIEDDARPSEQLLERYRGTAWVSAKAMSWLSRFPAVSQDNSNGTAFIYAVDPLGNIFMRYPADADTKLIAKDLRQVLKASQIG
jgi:cytochrome oxidase Cu insertion factor (SCO1/SenC/PrrC family)